VTFSLKHAFVSAKADGGDTTLVQPSNWNAEHSLTMATARLLGRTTAGTGAVEEISVGTGLSLTAGTLSNSGVTSVGGTGTVNGLTLTGTVTTSGNLTLGGTLSGIANSALTNSAITINGSAISLGGSVSVGTVTSVNLTAGTGISVSGGPVTSSGSITVTNSAPMVYPGAGVAVSTGSAWGTSLTAPSGALVGTTDTQTLSGKTITGTKETVFTVTDGASVDLDPANGGIQTWTLGASRTPTATNFTAAQSMTLLVDDGTAYTITWTTIGVTWLDAAGAPTLQTTGYTIIELFKVGSTVYGLSRR